MAYDRYDTRHGPRGERSRWSGERPDDRNWDREQGRGDRDERGFFERAGEEISSWFGGGDDDDRDERRYREQRGERERFREPGGSFGRDDDRFGPSRSPNREPWGSDRDRDFPREQPRGDRSGYRPMTGDYARSEGRFGSDDDRPRASNRDRGRSDWDRDEYRRTSFAGSADRSQHHDPHYQSWRQRQVEELDREYEEYRREHQSKFESDFGNWRSQRQTKRQMLGQVREHMEVFGNDDQRVGTVDRVAGDRIILTKNDPEAGGAHHSLTCTDIDRVEDNRVLLGCSAEQAKQRWRDEDKGRALFEREDRGEAGPHMLDRSFSGTYR